MRKIDRLKREAREACEFRGHSMSNFHALDHPRGGRGRCASAFCYGCLKAVFVNTNPPPNGIEIGGEAVALGCED